MKYVIMKCTIISSLALLASAMFTIGAMRDKAVFMLPGVILVLIALFIHRGDI